MTAAIYAARAGLRFAVIEKEYGGTGQIAESVRVDNYPGLYGISGFEPGEKEFSANAVISAADDIRAL